MSKQTKLNEIVNLAAMEGITGGVARFLQARRVEYTVDSLLSLVDLLTKEMEDGQKELPLGESLAIPIASAVDLSQPFLIQLLDHGEEDNIRKTIRVIAAGEIMPILDKHAGKVIELHAQFIK